MTLQVSTKFANMTVLNIIAPDDATAVKTFTTQELRIYGGTVPATADAAASTLLCVITGPSAAALTWASSATAGVLLKSAQVWSGTVTGAGTQTATYYRYVSHADDDGATGSTYPRLQGIVSTAGTELVLSNTSLVNGATVTVSYAALSKSPS